MSTSVSAASSFVSGATSSDPYDYQVGFGNIFSSEAVPGALPESGRNVPQKCPYDLYSEHLSGTSFISSRATSQNVWIYRIRPSVAHYPVEPAEVESNIEACFSPHNANIIFTPLTYTWGALDLPLGTEKVNFVQGIKTIGGNGDATTKEGTAVHLYAANESMTSEAFCNNDGDFLIIPQMGRLDIQTEMGKMMVRPGEICVIQAGLRFKVTIPDGAARGYINEIFGSHFELPELGPIGANGLAHPRDFETPLARFDLDESRWKVVTKLAGKLYYYWQNHTPFDVVAWHGNYAPYKYNLEKFVAFAPPMKEQPDPTINCVLTAKSKISGVSVTELCVFSPKWVTTTNAYRLPYYHRAMATELLGIIFGEYKGSTREFGAGGLSCENSFMPHGETYEAWRNATTKELEPELAGAGSLSFMLHLSSHFGLTNFARNEHRNLQTEKSRGLWDNVKGHFLDHLEEVNEKLASVGRPVLQEKKDVV